MRSNTFSLLLLIFFSLLSVSFASMGVEVEDEVDAPVRMIRRPRSSMQQLQERQPFEFGTEASLARYTKTHKEAKTINIIDNGEQGKVATAGEDGVHEDGKSMTATNLSVF